MMRASLPRLPTVDPMSSGSVRRLYASLSLIHISPPFVEQCKDGRAAVPRDVGNLVAIVGVGRVGDVDGLLVLSLIHI